MNIAIILSIGESWEDFIEKGQDRLLLHNNYKQYAKEFKSVYVFSYGELGGRLRKNVFLIPNKYKIHRYLYCFLLPFINHSFLRKTQIIRGMQLGSVFSCLMAKLFLGTPYVINYGFDYFRVTKIEKKLVRAYLYLLAEKILLNASNAIIVTTLELKNKLGKNNKKIKLIPNSVNPNIFKVKMQKKDIDILYVGRFEKQKNLFYLIDALGFIKKKPKLVFVGSGSLRNELLAYARARKVEFTILKPQKHGKLSRVYNRAKIFVLPSSIEGHPKALLEAMSCGLCVIGTNVSGIKSIIKHRKNGFLVPINHSSTLAECIEKLLINSSLRNEMGRESIRIVQKKYNYATLWKREIRLLKQSADK